MVTPGQSRPWIVGVVSRAAIAGLVFGLAMIIVSSQPAHAQTYSVIHSFTGGNNGANPYAGVSIDATGTLYGTTLKGGSGYGTVFSLKQSGSNWTFTQLYSFHGGSDGAGPVARVVTAPNGTLYGSTSAGGAGSCRGTYSGCGTVYSLNPSVGACLGFNCSWTEKVLYRFHGLDGAYPQGDLAFSSNGKIYGTTVNGGLTGIGTIFVLSPSGSSWLQNVILELDDALQGAYPWGGVTFDSEGNLYGVLAHDGLSGYGTLYKLTPSSLGWIESNVHGFTAGSDGSIPQGGITMDSSGKMYGTTVYGGPGSGGVVYEETASGNNWSHHILHGFSGGLGLGSYDKLAADSAGNLYGTTFGDGSSNSGTVFELTRSGNSYTYNLLHTFTGGSDGAYPFSTLAIDANGNLYGTASSGGINNQGVVFEISSIRH